MLLRLPLCILLIAASHCCFAQDITGTWHGFQVSRDNGQYKEYRVTIDFKVTDDNVTGTMHLKSPLKGIITSSFSGKLDKKESTVYLREDGIITEGIEAKDARLCSYELKVRKNMLKGKGRSRFKGYDHLTLRLQRGEKY